MPLMEGGPSRLARCQESLGELDSGERGARGSSAVSAAEHGDDASAEDARARHPSAPQTLAAVVAAAGHF